MKHTNPYFIILVVIGLLLISFFVFSLKQTETPEAPEPQGESLPGHQNISGLTENEDWKTFEDAELSYTFRYPESLETNYISTVDWPPQVQITPEPFTCTSAGDVIDRAGKTEEKVINGTQYCVSEISEGAAGSIYHQYAYGFELGESTVYLTASLRFVQCANYDEPEQSDCKNEQETFEIDTLMDRIVQTLVIGQN